MEHLNYCRQIRKQIDALQGSNRLNVHQQLLWSNLHDMASESVKFLLPENGMLIEDLDLRGLDEEIELRLPHGLIAIEWRHTAPHEPGSEQSTKRVVFAKEEGNAVVCWSVAFVDKRALWVPLPHFWFPRRGYITRTTNGIRMNLGCSMPESAGDIHAEAERVLGLLNALQCTNVSIERSARKNADKQVKTALNFDDYHVLTIKRQAAAASDSAGGSHRSPREHLRRGHIRRLGDGRKVWVNATVVAAALGCGVVSKSYAMQGPTP